MRMWRGVRCLRDYIHRESRLGFVQFRFIDPLLVFYSNRYHHHKLFIYARSLPQSLFCLVDRFEMRVWHFLLDLGLIPPQLLNIAPKFNVATKSRTEQLKPVRQVSGSSTSLLGHWETLWIYWIPAHDVVWPRACHWTVSYVASRVIGLHNKA